MAAQKHAAQQQAGSAFSVPGFKIGAVSAGLKKSGRLDLAVAVSERPCTAAGVFTRNRVTGAPVKLDRKHLEASPTHRAVVVNSKISNVCTGAAGLRDARAMAEQVARAVGCAAEEVFVASTGVIGMPLPMDKIASGIDAALGRRRARGFAPFAEAIMTTDTYPKAARRKANLFGRPATVAGVAKGSGMIHPNMATMLCFIFTDAAVEKDLLQRMVRRVADKSFNCVTVDGDTSTSDTMLVLANGASGMDPLYQEGPESDEFEEALLGVATDLAREIARDGEGAQHLVAVEVAGTRTDMQAKRIAHAIATSPLVKTAVFGRDANWGRIAAAAGRAGVAFAEKRLDVRLNGFDLMQHGEPLPFDEAALTKTFDEPEVVIQVRVGDGDGIATVWTCDLTDDYIRINADYRT